MKAVIASYTLMDGKADEFQAVAKKLVEETRKEKGCIFYECCKNSDDPSKYIMMEKWESDESIEAHMQTAHFLELIPKMRALLADRVVERFSAI